MIAGALAPYVLGLDIGTASIGWALVATEKGEPTGLIKAGARIFPAGMEGNIEAGQAEPRNAQRRQARQQRRQTDRRARRKRKLYHVLQRHGLLPAGRARDVLPTLDQGLLGRHATEMGGNLPRDRLANILPYWLRARALDTPLDAHELGRALYHLAQRRGFLSNRRAPRRDKDEQGKVKTGISELDHAMQQAGARTLGEYFGGLDPREQRIRARYTSRAMYEREFQALWDSQKQHHPGLLTDQLRSEVHEAIFYQRPLRKQKDLIGHCDLEPKRRRAPWASPEAQRFRLLQKANDTRIISPDGIEREPTQDERAALLDELERKGKITFAKARRAMGLSRQHRLNWEEGGEKSLPGDSTNERLAGVFGDEWYSFCPEKRAAIIEDVRSFEKEDALARRGMRAWGLEEEAAARFAQTELEEGYCNHSHRALRRLLPHMERGTAYMQAVKEEYPDRLRPAEVHDELPPLNRTGIEIRNPAVTRVLGELRRVVNAVIREYGKPACIRIELARDLRRTKKQRQQTWERNRQNQRAREAAAGKIEAELGIQNPTRTDIEKVLLAEECNWTCPYTGRTISMHALFGEHPEFETEHIIPFSRSLNNSFMNKTLCEVRENRQRKRNRTPFEAYGYEDDGWDRIVQRVKDFRGTGRNEKLRRLQTPDAESLDEVVTQQLNDTRYATRLTTEYVALLYGGYWDAEGARRVQASRGGTTAYLRDMWGLNMMLGDGGSKSRDDHRHHAVDAVTVALTTPAAVKSITQAQDDRRRAGRIRFGVVSLPWADFLDGVRQGVDEINVSHAVQRKVRGALHEETFYGRSRETDEDGRPVSLHVRKRLDDLSAKEIKHIVDPHVRELVRARLDEIGGTPKQAFKEPKNHPFLTTRDGRSIPIHKVRIRKAARATPIGRRPHQRHVLTGGNHHMEIVQTTDRRGRPKWKGYLVPMFEAARRVRGGEPLVKTQHGEGERFILALAKHDMILLGEDPENQRLCIVRKISHDRVEFVSARDARDAKTVQRSGEWGRPRVNSLMRQGCRRVLVTPLGELRWAND